jgi:fluoroquinolone transport system permease protein
MKTSDVLQALGPIDVKSVQRDAMLRWMIALPLVIAAAVRLVLPPIVERLDGWLTVDLTALYPDLMGYIFLLLVPYLWGVVIGFLLLDQRDEGTLLALQVTPLPNGTYLAYRLALPVALSVVTTLLVFPLANLARLSPGPLLLLALSAAPQAPLFALILAALARNKVQGLALMKASSVLLLPPFFAYFLPGAGKWFLAIFPTFWPAELFWHITGGGSGAWLIFTAGLAYQSILVALLARRFETIMHR